MRRSTGSCPVPAGEKRRRGDGPVSASEGPPPATNSVHRRLAIFLPSLVGGGAERVSLNLASEVANRGVSVDLVVSQAVGAYASDVPASVRLVDLGTSRLSTSLPALVRYLRRHRPDAMLTVMSHANVVGTSAASLARTSARVVVSEHDTLSEVTARTVRRRARLMPILAAKVYPKADSIVAVSSGVADDLSAQTGLDRADIEVIYNPVITPEVEVAVRQSVDHPWFLPGQPPVVLGIGRLAPKKDFPTLLRAFARVRGQSPARLIILGDGPDRDDLAQLSRELGIEDDVSLPGFVDNPYAYLAAASTFVLSSRWEGLPTVLIEALYCGTPVVATDCPSGPREILADGRHGLLVPVDDVAAIAGGITRGIHGELPRPTEESWRPYELGRVTDQYLDVLFGESGSVAAPGEGAS